MPDTDAAAPSAPVVESTGVDWLTCTAKRARENEPFADLGRELVAAEAAQGLEVRTARSMGYKGTAAGGATFGVRHDGWMIQLRSDLARDRWRAAAQLASNISRLDVQFTVRLPSPQPQLFKEQFEQARAAKRGRGRASSLQLIQSTTNGDSLYCGSRSSDLYARVYDKGREERTDPAGLRVRYELELKREAARLNATQLLGAEANGPQIISMLSTYLQARGVDCPISTEQFCEVLTRGSRSSSDPLRWLGSGVRPSVERLRACGRANEVIHALGLCDLLAVACVVCYPPKTGGKRRGRNI